MSGIRDVLVRDKEHLLACSALCRMQLRRQVNGVRDSLRWRRVATQAVAAPLGYRIAFGLVVSWAGLPRATRLIHLAGRFVGFARIASSIIDGVHTGVAHNSRGAR